MFIPLEDLKGFENIDTVLTNRSDKGAVFSNGVKVGELQTKGGRIWLQFCSSRRC